MLDEFESSARLLPPAEKNAGVQLSLELPPAEEIEVAQLSLELSPDEDKAVTLASPELAPTEERAVEQAWPEEPLAEEKPLVLVSPQLPPAEEKVKVPASPELPPAEEKAVVLPSPKPPAEEKVTVRPSLQEKSDRPFRVKLRGSVLVLVRLPNKRSVRAALHQLSTSGGVIHFEKPLDEKLEVELIFHLQKKTIRGKAQLLFPMWATQGWMQPFRFVDMPAASRDTLDAGLKSFLSEGTKSAAAGA